MNAAPAAKIEPLPAKKGPKSSDKDDDAAPAAASRRGPALLPTGLSRAIVIAALLWAAVMVTNGLLGGRYELIPAPSSDNNFMYRLDRLTGAVSFCGAQQCVRVPLKSAN